MDILFTGLGAKAGFSFPKDLEINLESWNLSDKLLFSSTAYADICFWVNYNDLTRPNSPQMLVSVGNIPLDDV